MTNPVIVIGAGMAGLSCARTLQNAGLETLVLEASDEVGGRIRTDQLDGFLLDRGFQVLLTSYPELNSIDAEALDLQPFQPGALIRTERGMQRLVDPWRKPSALFATARAAVGSLADKLRIGKLRLDVSRGPSEEILSWPEQSTLRDLRQRGFSEIMIERFMKPFLGGIFLESELETSNRMFLYVFRMFSQGDATLPSGGMQSLPEQLKSQLQSQSIQLNAPVAAIENDRIVTQQGESLRYSRVVIATDQSAAAKLVPELATDRTPRSVNCCYFSAPQSPLKHPMLALNGTGSGLINNLCVPSDIAPQYAPPGKSLVSVTALSQINSNEDRQQLMGELKEWFGDQVDDWQHLRTYYIPEALPNQASPYFNPPQQPAHVRDNLFVCGDYRENASINGAMSSGRRTAETIIKQLQFH